MVAVGLWLEMSIQILKLPDFVELTREFLYECNSKYILVYIYIL